MGWRAALISVFMLLPGLVAVQPARAQSPAAVLEQHLASGATARADAALAAVLARSPEDADAAFALGVARFAGAVERFGQGLYRYGLRPPRSMMLPILSFPIPANPAPEKITYEAFRALLAGFVRDLDTAEQALARVGERPVKLRLDLSKVRVDINGDGAAGEDELLASLLAGAPRGPRTQPAPAITPFAVAFDTADAFWMRGYCNLMAIFAEFFLAHDFRETFEGTFHLFFPAADLPFQRMIGEGRQREIRPGDFVSEGGTIADAVALLHLMRWPLAEPERMQAVHRRLKAVVGLNRQTWTAARAETDDDHEWLPNPKQKGVLNGLPVSEEMITGWLGMLDQLEAMLEGKLLVPHWRFQKGFNLRRFLLEPRPFDFVLMITGHGALPYLEDGPTASREDWQRMASVFRGNFLGYAFYFN